MLGGNRGRAFVGGGRCSLGYCLSQTAWGGCIPVVECQLLVPEYDPTSVTSRELRLNQVAYLAFREQ